MYSELDFQLHEVHKVPVFARVLGDDAPLNHQVSIVREVPRTALEILAGNLHALTEVFHVFGPFIKHVNPHVILYTIIVHLTAHVLQLQYQLAVVVLIFILALPVLQPEDKRTTLHILRQNTCPGLFVFQVLRVIKVDAGHDLGLLVGDHGGADTAGLGNALNGVPRLLSLF